MMKRKDKTPANGDELPIRNSTAEFLIFVKDSGANTISVRFQDKMLWLTLQLIADLFDVAKSTVSEHLSNVFSSGELARDATVRNFRTVRQEYKNDFDRQLDLLEEQARQANGGDAEGKN